MPTLTCNELELANLLSNANTTQYTAPELTIVREGVSLLDYCYALLFEGCLTEGLDKLMAGLTELRSRFSATPDDWAFFAETTCHEHPIAGLLSQDPITNYASHSRHGHTTDGTLTSLLLREATSDETLVAKGVNACVRSLPASRGISARLDTVAQRAEEIRNENADSRIAVIEGGTVSTWIDGEQSTTTAAVRHLISHTVEFRDMDLVCAPLIYDNLSNDEARRLSEAMMTMLRPGGRLLIANASRETVDAGYREAYLNWRMTCRNEAELVALTSGIPSRYVSQVRLYCDPDATVFFIEVFRK